MSISGKQLCLGMLIISVCLGMLIISVCLGMLIICMRLGMFIICVHLSHGGLSAGHACNIHVHSEPKWLQELSKVAQGLEQSITTDESHE